MADNRDTFVSEIYVNNEQANDAIAEMTKQLTKLTDKYDDLAAKNEKLAAKTNKAKAAMEETAKALEGMKEGTEEYAKTSKKLKEQEKAYNDLAKKLEISKHKTDQAKREMDSMQESIKRADDGVRKFGKAMENLTGKSMENLVRMQRQLRSELDKTKPNTKEWDELAKKYQQVTAEMKRLEAVQSGVVIKQRGWLQRLNGVSSAFLFLGQAARTAIALARRFADAYKTISNFEQANANLASIMGANSEQMERLEKAAVGLGSASRYTASQVTALQTELAKLGFTSDQIMKMQKAVLNFAGAVGTDLASAAQLSGVALRSFGLTSDKTEDALGTMAVACNKSALSFTYLQNSFSTIAPVAKSYGLSLKDTIALLGTLANAGFDASSAATATRNILLNLADANGKLAQRLGGSVHSFEEIIAAIIKLREEGVDLNEALELTDKRSVAAFETFLEGAESARELRGALEEVNGELQRMAEERANTVEGAIDQMKSAWEGFVLSFRQSTGPMKRAINGLTAAIEGMWIAMDPEGYGRTHSDDITELFEQMTDDTHDQIEAFDRLTKKYYDKRAELEDSSEDMRERIGGRKWMSWIPGLNAVKGVRDVDATLKISANETMLGRYDEAYEKVTEDLKRRVEIAVQEVAKVEAEYAEKYARIEAAIAETTDEARKEQLKKDLQYWKSREAFAKKAAATPSMNPAAYVSKEQLAEQERMAEEAQSAADKAAKERDEKAEKERKKAEIARKQEYSKKKAQMEAFYNYQEKTLKVAWLSGEMGEAEYNQAVYEAKAEHYKSLLGLAQKYGQSDAEIRNKMLDDHIKALEAEKKRVKEEMEEIEQFNQPKNKNVGRKSYSMKEAEDEALNPKDGFEATILKKAADIRAAITEDSARTEYETEMMWAEKLAEKKIITAEEAEKYILQAKIKYAQKAAEQVNQITEMASNFVTQMKEMETAQIEEEYQKQLTDAGDNAEKREQIEADYEQKKLDMQKKYADADMVINIAKTIGAGALAVMQAFAQLGPVAGAIAAVLVGATTAAEVATIIAQRNAIKNTSVNNSSSSSSGKTGQRTVTGYSEGGYTDHAGSDHKAMGVVHANEWVAPAWMVRRNPVVFSNLESVRRAGSHGRSGSAGRGFADGGYAGNGGGPSTGSGTASYTADIEAAVEVAIRRAMTDGAIRAYLVRKDLTELDNQTERFKKQTSR